MKAFFYPILDSVMIEIEHDILTKCFKIKPLTFVGFEIVDAFMLIIDYYERLRKIGIVEQHGVQFVTF